MTENEILFINAVHDPALRIVLLERLEQLGLLSAFQAVENETT